MQYGSWIRVRFSSFACASLLEIVLEYLDHIVCCVSKCSLPESICVSWILNVVFFLISCKQQTKQPRFCSKPRIYLAFKWCYKQICNQDRSLSALIEIWSMFGGVEWTVQTPSWFSSSFLSFLQRVPSSSTMLIEYPPTHELKLGSVTIDTNYSYCQ